ncbi:hypothetical protein B0F90DRAFT_1757064 [Multifurca ochricompacta]|uniref:Uncharacterized protein n=1 Tax=Multifurca ochricompacta TaxID=376703 RepID=A0AAD4QKL5_9AGAM|nr:hypothetical protein B0F90DRAFT_1757064 [Multifurca ochricompacta]
MTAVKWHVVKLRRIVWVLPFASSLLVMCLARLRETKSQSRRLRPRLSTVHTSAIAIVKISRNLITKWMIWVT